MLLRSSIAMEGRRPAALAMPRSTCGASRLGTFLAHAAYLAEASAMAYARLCRELKAHGAPLELIERCGAARLAKLRRACALGRLAVDNGVQPMSPEPRLLAVRPLVEVALENVVEGLVREVYSAAVITVCAQRANAPSVRRAMEAIAEDERDQAGLALDVAAWLQARIDPIEGAWVEDKLRHAVVDLARELDHEPDPELVHALGLPSRLDALWIWRYLSHRVWHGLAERVWTKRLCSPGCSRRSAREQSG